VGPAAPQSQDELQSLKQQAEVLKQQKQEIETRMAGLQSGRRVVAFIHTEECTGCGVCADVCPNDAIRIDKQAVVDPGRCTACAACVSACPNGAIIITQQETR
jgi:ferredoxin